MGFLLLFKDVDSFKRKREFEQVLLKYRSRCLDWLHRKCFANCSRSILLVAKTKALQKQQTSFLLRHTWIPLAPPHS